MTIEINPKEDPSIDFTLEPEVQQVVDTETAIDASAALTLASGDVNSQTREKEVSTITMHGKSDVFDQLSAEQQLERELELEEDAIDNATDPEMSDEEKIESLNNIATVAKDKTPRLYNEVVARELSKKLILPSQNDAMYQTAMHDYVARHSQLSNQFQEYIGKTMLESLGGDYDALEAIYDGFEMVVPFEFADKYVDWAKEFYGDSNISDRLLPGEIAHKFKTDLANQPTPELKLARFKDMIDSLAKVEGLWFADGNKMGMMFLANSIADPNFDPEHDFDWDRLIENVANVLDVTLVGGPALRTVANPFKMINVVGRFNPRAGDALLTKALQKGQVEELGVKKSEVLAESHLPASGRDTSIPDDLLGEVERIDNLINRAIEVGNKQALEYSVRRKLAIEEKIAAHDTGYARINMSRARRMTEKELKGAKAVDGVKPNTILTIRKGTSRLTGYKSTSSAIAAAKRGGYTDFKIMVNRAGEWIEYKKGMKKDPVDEFYYEAKVQEYIPEDSSFLSFKDMRPGAVMSFINPSWSRLTKDVYSLFGKEDALRLGSQTDVRSGIEAIINSANVHYGSLTVKSKNKVLRYLREMEETPNKRYTYSDLVENGLEGYDRLTKQEWLALEGIRRTSDAQHAITDLKIATELREAGYKSIRTTDGTNIYGKKVDKPESVVDDFEAILDVATGLGREKDADLIKMIKNGEVEIYKLRGKENLTESMTMGRGESSYVTDATHKYSYALVTRDSVKQVTDVPQRGVLPYINNYVYRDYSNKFFIYKVDSRTHVDGKRVDKTSQEAATIVAAVDRRSDVQGMIDTIKGELSADEAKHITFDYRIGREFMEGLGDGEAAFENAKLSGLLHRGKRGPLLRSTSENAGNLRPVGAALQRSFNKLADNLAMDDFIRVAKQDFLRRYKDVLNLGKDAEKFPMKLPPNLKGGKEWDEMAAAHEYIQFLGNMKDNVWRRKTMQWNFRMADFLDARGYKGRALYTASEIIATKVLTPDWIRSIPFLTAIVANPVRQFAMQALQHQLVASINPKLFLKGTGYKETYALLAGMMARHLDNAELRRVAKALKPKDQSVDEFLKDIEDLAESGLFEAVSTHHIAEGMVYLNRGLEGFEGGLALRGAQAQKALASITNAVKKVGFDSGEYFNLAATRVAARHHLKATKKGYTARDLNELSRAWAMGMNTGGKFMHQDVPFLNLFTQFFSFQQKSLAILRRAISETGGNQAFTKQQARRMAMIQVANYGAYGLGMSWLVNGIFDEIEQAAGAPVPETVRDVATYGATNYLFNFMLGQIYDEEEIPRINWGSVGAPFSGYTFLAESMYDTLMSEDESTLLAFLGASGMWLQKVDKNVENMFTAFNVMGVDPERDADVAMYALKNFGAIMSSGLSNFWKTELVNGVHMLKDSSGDPVIELAASEVLAQKWLGTEITHGYWDVANDERAIEKEAREEGTRIANVFYATLKEHDDPIEVMQQIMSYTSLISDEYKRSAIRKAAVREFTERMQMGESKAKKLIERFATQGVGSRDILSSRLLRLANNPQEKQMIREFLDVLFKEHSDPFSGEDE